MASFTEFNELEKQDSQKKTTEFVEFDKLEKKEASNFKEFDEFESMEEEPAPIQPSQEETPGLLSRIGTSFGQALAFQGKAAPAAQALPQLAAGALGELSFGAVDVLPAKTPAEKAFRTTGALVIGLPLVGAGLTKVVKPLGKLSKVLAVAAFGGERSGLKQYFKSGEIKGKDVAIEAAMWGTFEGIGQLLGKAAQFFRGQKSGELPTAAKELNPVARKLDSLNRVLESNASAGEKVNAQAAIDRLTGKYNVRTGLENAASNEGLSIPQTFTKIWDKVTKWSQNILKKTVNRNKPNPEATEKFVEFVQKAEQEGIQALEPLTVQPKVTTKLPVPSVTTQVPAVAQEQPGTAALAFRAPEEAAKTSRLTGKPIPSIEDQIIRGLKSGIEERTVALNQHKDALKEFPESDFHIDSIKDLKRTIAEDQKRLKKLEQAKPQAPTKATEKKTQIFRGFGRAEKGSVVPILGSGKYFAFSPEAAKEFGPKIETRDLDLKNPLKINSDKEWKALTKEAGWKFPNPTGLPAEEQKRLTNNMSNLIKDKGHDGVIINWDNTTRTDVDKFGNSVKLLRDVFDTPQVFFPDIAKTKVVSKQPTTEKQEPKPTVAKPQEKRPFEKRHEKLSLPELREEKKDLEASFRKETKGANRDRTLNALSNRLASVDEQILLRKKEAARSKPPTTPPPSKPPPSKPPGPPSGPNPASPLRITEETAKFFSKFAAKLNVEFPFQKIKAPETGFAVKNYFDQYNIKLEQGTDLVKKLKKLKLTPEQHANAILQSESATPPTDPKERAAWEIYRPYFDDSLQELKKKGVLVKGFEERILDELKSELAATSAQIKEAKGKGRDKLVAESVRLKAEIEALKDFRFVSIPAQYLFQKEFKTSEAPVIRRAISFLNKKKRKTFALSDLVTSGLVDKKDLTPSLIINSYARRLGRDVAIANIINAAKKEGLATRDEIPGYVKIPGYLAPELARFFVHPVFADFIKGYTEPRTFSRWEKMAGFLKGWSFYNPAILPANDIAQQLWAVLGRPDRLLKLGPAWKQAIVDMAKKTPNYWEAYSNGLFSSPFVEFNNSLSAFKQDVDKSENSLLASLVNKALKLPIKIHENIYGLMSRLAWGADKAIRLATFNWFRSQGLTPREAAQNAALFHGDFSRVPPATRRQLNKFLYTGTFKLVMGAALKENVKHSIELAKALYKGEKVSNNTKARAAGLLGALIGLGSVHLVMRANGFKADIPGLRYKKDIIDVNGNPKTLRINFSLPFSIFLKFGARLFESALKPGVQNRLMKFVKSMKFELAIPIQMAWELLENKNTRWEQIYDPKETTLHQATQVLSFIAKRALPLVGAAAGEGFRSEEDAAKVRDELGRFVTVIPSMFPFVTNRQNVINARKIKRLQSELKALLRKKKGDVSQRQKDAFLKEINRLSEEISNQ